MALGEITIDPAQLIPLIKAIMSSTYAVSTELALEPRYQQALQLHGPLICALLVFRAQGGTDQDWEEFWKSDLAYADTLFTEFKEHVKHEQPDDTDVCES